MDILKIAALAVFLSIMCLIVRQYKPEYAVVMQVSAFCVVALMLFTYIEGLLVSAQEITQLSSINIEFFMLLVKALGVAIVSQIASKICEDSDNKTLAFGVDLAGRVIILSLSIPMIKAVTEVALELIKGS